MSLRETASLHKNRVTTLGRVNGFLSTDNNFKDINLPAKLYTEITPITITHWKLPLEDSWKDWEFSKIIEEPFLPTDIGAEFGPTWSTHWFKLDITIPSGWTGKEVHLRWKSNSEGTVRDTAGHVLQGLSPGYREEYIIKEWPGSGNLTLYIEMACNDMFGAGEGNLIAPPNIERKYKLEKGEIALFDREIFEFIEAFQMLNGMASQLSTDHRGFQALYTANEMMNLIKKGDEANRTKAKELAASFFAEKNGDKAHTLYAMGHCHIDTAWLWPYDETIRKCARSFSAQIGLMEEYPDYIFVCSQAQQYDWVREYYPDLFEKIKEKYAERKFIPVGGTWIEMDGNIPNGESFIRQFFYGQKFYNDHFGVTCKEFWLPDTFGYSAQIPQMIKHMEIERFLTQKMSWSIVNKFPHHNFVWEGIDGSQVLSHFPPGDSYNMNATVQELLYSVNNSEDKGRSNVGVYLFGFGDGGGGATRNMLQRLKNVKDVDGLPKVVSGTSDQFFDALEQEKGKLSKWIGELYLELHNGTYTSQAKIKWYNRKGEILLREVELLMCIARVKNLIPNPDLILDMAQVDKDWQNFLLNQFHDVLPGTSIEIAMNDAWRIYRVLFTSLMRIREKYCSLILASQTTPTTKDVLYNALSWNVENIVIFTDEASITVGPNVQEVELNSTAFDDQNPGRYRIPNKFKAAIVNMGASGFTKFNAQTPTINPVIYNAIDDEFDNGLVKVKFETNPEGIPYEEVFMKESNGDWWQVFAPAPKDSVSPGMRGAMFYIYDDVPLYWDAWDVMDYHLETQQLPLFLDTFSGNVAQGPIVGVRKFTAKMGNNGTLIERYTVIRANTPMIEYYTIIDWKEDRKLLKVEFPVDVRSTEATYEIQYGHVSRPNHINTSWDMAKFEVVGHKWADISQGDRGVAILSDSKYGWCVRENVIKLSLLKAPKNPDVNCDITDPSGVVIENPDFKNRHFMYYAILPHEGNLRDSSVIKKSYELNYIGSNNVALYNTTLADGDLPIELVTVDKESVIVTAFKICHANFGQVVLRLYESFGGTAKTNIKLGFTPSAVVECNGLENKTGDVVLIGDSFEVKFSPFQIRSFLITI